MLSLLLKLNSVQFILIFFFVLYFSLARTCVRLEPSYHISSSITICIASRNIIIWFWWLSILQLFYIFTALRSSPSLRSSWYTPPNFLYEPAHRSKTNFQLYVVATIRSRFLGSRCVYAKRDHKRPGSCRVGYGLFRRQCARSGASIKAHNTPP